MPVDITTDRSFHASPARALFRPSDVLADLEISPDGQRSLFAVPVTPRPPFDIPQTPTSGRVRNPKHSAADASRSFDILIGFASRPHCTDAAHGSDQTLRLHPEERRPPALGDFTIFNASGTVQTNEQGPTGNRNFGTPQISTQYGDDGLQGWFKRGYTWETNVSVQHELLPRVGVGALYYRRSAGNQRVTDSRAIAASRFDGPFCITAPDDERLPNSGQQVCGLYDIKPQFRAVQGRTTT